MGCEVSKPDKHELLHGRVSLVQRDKLLREFRDISTELESDAMLQRTINAILNLLPVERASVFLVDHTGGVMRTFNKIEQEKSGSLSAGKIVENRNGESTTQQTIPTSKAVSIPIDSGIAGAVVSSAKSVVVPNANADPRFNRTVDEQTGFRTRNIICVPVKLRSQKLDDMEERRTMMKQQQQRPGHAGMEKPPKVVAVLQALNNKNGDFEWTDVAVLEALASLLSGVLARFALIDEALREKSKATALLKVAEVLASQDNCRLKASNVIKAITSGCDCERASFVLVDEVRGEQSIFSLDDDIGNFSAPLHSGVSGAVIRECLPVHIRDAYKDPRFNQEGDGKSGFKTRDIMAVPIVRAGTKPPQVMGVIMALNSNETGFDAGNETLLRSVALQVAGRLMPELIQDMIEATVNDHGMGQEDVEKFKALLTAENAPSKAVQRMADQVVSGDMVNELISSPLAKSSGRLSPIQTRVPEEMNRVATPAGSGVYTPDARPTPLPDATRVSLPVLNSATLFLQPRGLSSDELISWDLDILELEPIELMQLAGAIFTESGVLQKFKIPAETFANFISAVGSRYKANPYHNWNHGVHVLLSSWLLVREERRRSRVDNRNEALSDHHLLALLVAAVAHDVDHPGVNNAFMINSNQPLALRYNDQSVLENHHAATTFAILSDPKCDMLSSLSAAERKDARSHMIGTILHTDMARHEEMLKALTVKAADQSTVSAAFTLEVLCHVADLGNCAIRWDLSKAWAGRMCEEAVGQAMREQELGLPFGRVTPYDDKDLMARQLVFLDGWVSPLFKAAAILYPCVKPRLEAIEQCRKACRDACRSVTWRSALQAWKTSSRLAVPPTEPASPEGDRLSKNGRRSSSTPSHLSASDIADEWLGRVHNNVALPDTLIEILSLGFKAEIWSTEDVPEQGGLLSTRQKELWKQILQDSVKSANKPELKSYWTRFDMWWDAQYPAEVVAEAEHEQRLKRTSSFTRVHV